MRSNRRLPKCSSSALICRLTEVSELGSARAAADRLPLSTARTKAAIAASWSKPDPSVFRKRACSRA
ncbi:hypothetical protein J2R89_002589 [Bradyrhizobium elkanii]|nr:hypothetical protein [Bradyrhizobium elkanii]